MLRCTLERSPPERFAVNGILLRPPGLARETCCMTSSRLPNSLDSFWMPFTPNKVFKADPRLVTRAEGMFYYTPDGRAVLDGTSGLWCVAAGHNQPKIVEAIRMAAGELDYAGSFNMGHPLAFEFANRLSTLTPEGMDRIFFTNSGSESVDTALKIALAYQVARGKPGKYRLIGRERAYHGVNFGGMSVGGITRNRVNFGPMVGGVDHLPHTHDITRNAFTRGQPKHGAEYADALERLVLLHDASTIAAVIVEPVAGSTGVLVPPQGYLQRLRELCTKHDILLIFDEVITGFGRVGKAFAAERFDVPPDMITTAKALGNGFPCAALLMTPRVTGAIKLEGLGTTFGGGPMACAVIEAVIEAIESEDLMANVRRVSAYIRNTCTVGPVTGHQGAGFLHGLRTSRPAKDVQTALLARNILAGTSGDPNVVRLLPPYVLQEQHVDLLREALSAL